MELTLDREFRLSKHHGLGNDFLVLMDMMNTVQLSRLEIVALLNRRTGVGADGLIRVLSASPNSEAVAVMELHNSDGSRAEMSGNGIRCLVQALVDANVAPNGRFVIATDAGLIDIECHSESGAVVANVSAGMGMPELISKEELKVGQFIFNSVRVNIGNPHLVLFPTGSFKEDDLEALDIATLGPKLESRYPGGMNIEWIVPAKNMREIRLRVWERGAGITQACGTGTTASAFAANLLGLVNNEVNVHNPGGDLLVRITKDQCYLMGPAHKVAEIQVGFAQLDAMVALVN